MKKKAAKRRVYVELTAVWGNDDADSTIKISRRRWQAIRAGAEYSTSASSWYEGKRDSVFWSFADGEVTIDGEDGFQAVVGLPIDALIVQEKS
jgi:hypothetical protein